MTTESRTNNTKVWEYQPSFVNHIHPGRKEEWQIDPIFHVYDNLIETLEANGYVEGTDLFPFAYDWKKSNADTAQKLKMK